MQLAVYSIPIILIFIWYVSVQMLANRRALAQKQAAVEAGLTEPASLHPLLDPTKCVGCGSCVNACPEGNVLGLIDRKAHLINPTHCIGHGACRLACPMGAITLVFGTEKRGVDIPHVDQRFETNVPGLFIAGELGGMGLIGNAVEQGRQAVEAIAKRDKSNEKDLLDLVIVGAGPAGLSASLAAKEKGLRFRTLDQETLGGTVAHFPRGKLVMTRPVTLPLVGKVKFTEISKEQLLDFWTRVVDETGLEINFNERVDKIEPNATGFNVTSPQATYRTRAVLLAIGRRGTPRKLDVPGEELNKVVYRLIDAEQYRGQQVLVVGGGDSALEAAASVAEQPGTTVTLSYRSGGFSRAKEKNRQRIAAAEAAGRLTVLFNSNVKQITEHQVTLDQEGKVIELANDAVIISAGGILPTGFLKSIGVSVETKHGTA